MNVLIKEIECHLENQIAGRSWLETAKKEGGRISVRSRECGDIWIESTSAQIIGPVLIWLSTSTQVNDEPKTLVTIGRLIICFYAMSQPLSRQTLELFHNTAPQHHGTGRVGEKEAKFSITMSLLNFRVRLLIKNHLRQHWLDRDRCSPWHLCDADIIHLTIIRWHVLAVENKYKKMFMYTSYHYRKCR